GIRGFDLASAILRGYDWVILVDAVARGGVPGTLYVLEPDTNALAAEQPRPELDGHSLSPAKVLQWVKALGGPLPRFRVVGCEPAIFDSDESSPAGLSPGVAAAVDEAVDLVLQLVNELADDPDTARIRTAMS